MGTEPGQTNSMSAGQTGMKQGPMEEFEISDQIRKYCKSNTSPSMFIY